MGFDMFARAAGFDEYHGRREYGTHDYDGHWGVFDHRFYRYFIAQTNRMRRPFVNVVFSLSSHHPYSVPAYLKTHFPQGTLPIHQAVRYADYSLKLFFEEARRQPWFDSTLFVITADHSGPNEKPAYQTQKGIYEVPLLFYMHGSRLRGAFPHTAQQTDVLPTVLGLLHYDEPFVAFGSALFDPKAPRFAVQYFSGQYQLANDSLVLQYDGRQVTGWYDLRGDPLLVSNLAGTQAPPARPLWLLQSYIQQFNHRMLYNELAP
jgi:phosphoglycerol transferase MdoB-like AlkP superfamily enzyme